MTLPLGERLMRLAAERPSASVLIHGPAGTGKTEAALSLSARLLDVGRIDPESARVPDFHLLRPAEGTISIDDARDAIEKLSLAPLNAPRHVLLVLEPEAATPQASNALLKTIEEPAGKNWIVLVSHQSSLLLPTIRSRCILVASARGGASREPDAAGDYAAWLAALDGTQSGFLSDRQAVEAVLTWMSQVTNPANPYEAFTANQLVKRLELDAASAQAALNDVLRAAVLTHRHAVETGDGFQYNNPLIFKNKPAAFAEAVSTVASGADSLERNANVSLVLEQMVLKLRKIRRGAAS